MELNVSFEQLKDLANQYVDDHVEIRFVKAMSFDQVDIEVRLFPDKIYGFNSNVLIKLLPVSGEYVGFCIEKYPVFPRAVISLIGRFNWLKKSLPSGLEFNSCEHTLFIHQNKIIEERLASEMVKEIKFVYQNSTVDKVGLNFRFKIE